MAGRPHLVIAVDGPAASGKGTLARRLAAYYGLSYTIRGHCTGPPDWRLRLPVLRRTTRRRP